MPSGISAEWAVVVMNPKREMMAARAPAERVNFWWPQEKVAGGENASGRLSQQYNRSLVEE